MKWLEYSLNILFWLISTAIIVSSFSIQGQEIEVVNNTEIVHTIRDIYIIYQLLACVLLAAVMFYSNLYTIRLLNRNGNKKKVILISALLLLSALGLLFLIEKFFFAPYPLLPFQINGSILLFYFTVSCAYGIVKLWIITEQKQKDLILLKNQTELNLLRNQLQPHFLFNALNNLLSLVDQKNSPLVANSIERLSQLLRYVIEETKPGKVNIQKEIEFVRNYCDLQLLRFEENEIDLEFNIIGMHDNQNIEPGIFIPFVENAFKYGTEPEKTSKISIQFNLNDAGKVGFIIQNEIRESASSMAGTGTGITTTKERLNLVYPNKHQLEIKNDKAFIVQVEIDTK